MVKHFFNQYLFQYIQQYYITDTMSWWTIKTKYTENNLLNFRVVTQFNSIPSKTLSWLKWNQFIDIIIDGLLEIGYIVSFFSIFKETGLLCCTWAAIRAFNSINVPISHTYDINWMTRFIIVALSLFDSWQISPVLSYRPILKVDQIMSTHSEEQDGESYHSNQFLRNTNGKTYVQPEYKCTD